MAKINLAMIGRGAGSILEGIFNPAPANPTAAATPPPTPGGGGDTPVKNTGATIWKMILIAGTLILGVFLVLKLLKR